jgi:O-antigen/teichoic acid export membrane protein
LIDQAIVSGTRFALAWSVARWTSPENYGAYALLLSTVLVLDVVQQALVTWPLAVLAAPLPVEGFRRYVAGLARVQLASALALAALGLAAALLAPAAWLDGRPLANGLAVSALLLAQQMQEFCRRVLLSRRPLGALGNDAAGAVLVLGGVAGLRAMAVRSGDPSWLASEHVLALSAVALGSAAAFGWMRMGELRGGPAPPLRALILEVWGFGRFILGSRLGEALLSQAQNFVVASFGGAAATAALEAPRMLLAPVQVAAFGAINFMLTRGAQALAHGGAPALRKEASRAGLLGGAAFAAYAAAFALWPSGWLALVYGGRYGDPVVLWIWCASHVLLGTRVILGSVLYLMRRTELVMKSMLAAGSSALLLSIPLSSTLSVRGAALARLAGEAVLLVLTLRLARRLTAPAPKGASS